MAHRSSQTTNFTSTTNYLANMPAGVVAHDRLYAAVIYDGFSATISGVPSGWTQIANGDCGPDTQSFRIFEKKDASGSEGATQGWTLSLAKSGQVIIEALSGRDNSAAVTFATVATQNTTVISPMAISGASGTAALNDDVIVFATVDQNVQAAVFTFGTWSGSLVEREDSGNGGNFCSSALATQNAVSAGAFGTVSVTATSVGNDGGWGIVTIAVPAAAAGGTSDQAILLA